MTSNLSAGFRYYNAGRIATREMPRVRSKVTKGFFISLLVLFLIASALVGLIFTLIFAPMKIWLLGHLPGWADWIGGVLAALVAVTLGLIALALSLRFTVILLGFFFEGSVHLIVERFRPETEPGQGGPPLLWEILREVFFFISLLLLELIPVAGWILAAVFSSWLVGKGIHAPHKAVLMDRGLDRSKPSHLACLSSGSAELFLILLPVVGWFLLPWFMIHMVIGQAWLYESERAAKLAAMPPV